MHVLIFNWRDIKNPQSGGAEILTHEISKYLVRKNHEVTVFTSEFPGSKKQETIDGVKIVRAGHPDLRHGFSSVHYNAYKYYKKKKFGHIDVVIDEVHGVPFFTPLYIKEKKAALICEYAGDLWKYAVPFPFSILGQLFEHLYPFLYKKDKIITISKSSKHELGKLFSEKMISVVYPGCLSPVIKNIPQKLFPLTFVFIARLAKTKGIEDAIEMMRILRKSEGNAKLYVIGRGDKDYVDKLKKDIQKKGLGSAIHFCGFVSDKEKYEIIDKSHILIAPSRKEGWGLTVHEVGARGVPTVGYNVLGLNEVIIKNVNGEICRVNTPYELAKLSLSLYRDKSRYKMLQKGALSERKKFTWEKTGETFLRQISENEKE
ncbi:MAG TPA: glycosyltransferase family 4 protein [Candidatus Levybacteria bacterium]|nr:glycosyltransferase family 4 protein [Candidatus Levybacteria bacterium]